MHSLCSSKCATDLFSHSSRAGRGAKLQKLRVSCTERLTPCTGPGGLPPIVFWSPPPPQLPVPSSCVHTSSAQTALHGPRIAEPMGAGNCLGDRMPATAPTPASVGCHQDEQAYACVLSPPCPAVAPHATQPPCPCLLPIPLWAEHPSYATTADPGTPLCQQPEVSGCQEELAFGKE